MNGRPAAGRETLLTDLQNAFEARAAEALERIASQAREAGAVREDLRALRQAVGELAAAQRQTNMAIVRLAEAVERLRRQAPEGRGPDDGDVEDIRIIF